MVVARQEGEIVSGCALGRLGGRGFYSETKVCYLHDSGQSKRAQIDDY